MSTVVLFSGGLDSTVLLYTTRARDSGVVVALSFDYGQRHLRELKSAKDITRALGIEWYVVSLDARLFGGSALTGFEHPIPQDMPFDDPRQSATIVPNRNAVMLTQAFAYAESLGINNVAWGAHAGDHAVYPDCTPGFAAAFQAMQDAALGHHIELQRPFMDVDKAQIVALGTMLRVPFEDTWTCYMGGALACGSCGSCTERLAAFEANGIQDPLRYARQAR